MIYLIFIGLIVTIGVPLGILLAAYIALWLISREDEEDDY